MNIITSPTRPLEIETIGTSIVVRFHITEEQDGTFSYEEVTIKGGAIGSTFTYPTLVSALVRSRYSADAMEAALFNAKPEEIEAINAWRAEAKSIARTFFQDNE